MRRGWVDWLLPGIVVGLAIGVALFAGSAGAQSGEPIATIEATDFTIEIGGGQTGEEFAVCPANKRALGGGVVQSGSPSGLFTHASGPLDATGTTSQTTDGDVATQWYAAVLNQSGSDASLKVFAICSAASDALVEATDFTIGSDGNGEAFAVCPGNERALGGGVVQSGSPGNVFTRASGPLDATGTTSLTTDGDIPAQWYAAVQGPPGTALKVFAICSAASDATIEATDLRLKSPKDGKAVAKCRGKDKSALGGGVVQSGPASGDFYTLTSGPLAGGKISKTNDGDVAKRWYAAVGNYSGNTVDFKVFAICASTSGSGGTSSGGASSGSSGASSSGASSGTSG